MRRTEFAATFPEASLVTKKPPEHWIHSIARGEIGAEVQLSSELVAVEQALEPERWEQRHFVAPVKPCRLLATTGPARGRMLVEPQRNPWAWHNGCPAGPIAAEVRY